MKFLHLVLCPWICSSVSWFTVNGNLNRICILLLCENCINLNYVELVDSAFQVYYPRTPPSLPHHLHCGMYLGNSPVTRLGIEHKQMYHELLLSLLSENLL